MKTARPIPKPSDALVALLDHACREVCGDHAVDVDTRYCTRCGLPAEAIEAYAA